MKRVLTTAASLAVCATAASAGGLERSAPSSAILFEDGEYAEFSISTVSPTVSGVFMGAVPGGDMAQAYQNWSFGYKRDFGENLAFALVVDQPFGADVAYPAGGLYPLAGSTAVLSSFSVNGMLRYRLPSNVSVFGGLRLQSLQGNIALSSPAGPFYVLDAPAEWDLGYALGVAYERPEIALRVALSYYSEITHTFGDNAGTPFDVVTPQSLNLEFQSGIAANTLLFGSIRWVDWTETEIAPADYVAGFGSPLVEYSNDTTT